HRHMLFILLILVGPPPVCIEQQPTRDFAAIRTADATKISGTWVRMRIELNSLPEARDGFVAFDCASADATHRTVWFVVGETGGDDADVKPRGDCDKLEVIGRLSVVEHPPNRFGTTSFPGFTELRLLDARLVR